MRGYLILLPLLLTACAGSYQAPELTERQAAKLETALAGKIPGKKVSCVPRQPSSNLTAISNNVLLYRVSSRLIYRNDLIGSCAGLSRGDTLIVKSYSSPYCRGDMASSADLVAGMVTGSCALGDFTPYRSPGY